MPDGALLGGASLSINRLSRNPSVTFRVEEQLGEEGVRLWAIDEPFEESFRLDRAAPRQRRTGTRLPARVEGEVTSGNRDRGQAVTPRWRKALYGYRFAEHEHPNPHKAQQGLKVKVLEPDLVTAPVVKLIFHDYVVNSLTITELVRKLNNDLERLPPPQSPDPKRRTGMWGRSSVWEILHNPKYTGYQVWTRRQRKRGGKINPA